MTLSREERETIICYNEADQTASVYTHNQALSRRLADIAQQRPEECCKTKALPSGAVEYTVPKRWVKITPPRQMSEEQREAAAERCRNLAFERKT